MHERIQLREKGKYVRIAVRMPSTPLDADASVNHWDRCYFNDQYDDEECQPEDGYVRPGADSQSLQGEEIPVP
jgi:hypothetical protein